MDKILKVNVVYEAHVFDLGECDADHISLISLVHAMTKEVTGSSELPSGGFTVRAELPWSKDTIVVLTYSELLDVFREFGNRRYDEICFQIEKILHSPIDEPEVVEQIGWCNEEAGMFDFTVDSEGEDTESGDAQFEKGVESDGDTGEGVNNGMEVVLDGMEDEGVQTGEGVNNGVGVGLYGMEDEGVQTGDGVKNGEDVHVGEGYEDEITKQCISLFDGYEFRVYNNSEAKVKWIASKVESLVKSNPTMGAKVLGDLILERDQVELEVVFNNLKMFLQFPENRHLCFMSDRHKGLVKALQTHFPLVSTRFCARHIFTNFRSSYPGHNYKKMF
ncbi:hypothetical protein Ddye_026019 [Dipteronia dyeriana]|uniref:MULE transposase domain-containing protein n=1 Tax=Dipteronia dyeriana TaxID=168575 RepID=A0AAD9TMB7_9ROSI|nr:hypothetical protein Ddye_026019 [Dipteronia dyeriana]